MSTLVWDRNNLFGLFITITTLFYKFCKFDSVIDTLVKTVIDTLVELSDSHEEVFVYDELYFELHFDELSNLSAKFQHTLVEIL